MGSKGDEGERVGLLREIYSRIYIIGGFLIIDTERKTKFQSRDQVQYHKPLLGGGGGLLFVAIPSRSCDASRHAYQIGMKNRGRTGDSQEKARRRDFGVRN